MKVLVVEWSCPSCCSEGEVTYLADCDADDVAEMIVIQHEKVGDGCPGRAKDLVVEDVREGYLDEEGQA